MKTLILIAFVLLFGPNFAPEKNDKVEKKELAGTLFLSYDFHVTKDYYFCGGDKPSKFFLSKDLGFNSTLCELHIALFILSFVLAFACIFTLNVEDFNLNIWSAILSLLGTFFLFICLFFSSSYFYIGNVLPNLKFLILNLVLFYLLLRFVYKVFAKPYFERFH